MNQSETDKSQAGPPPGGAGRFRKLPIKHLRWYIAILLCLASALNYLDRQTLSVLIGIIKDELNLTNASYGAINAWFLVSYGVMYAVSGRIIDFIGTRRGFMLFVSGWSVANMLHILASTVGQFSFFRFLLGVFEPGSFTGGVRAVSEWFPMKDRALAIGIFNAGTAFGSMAAAPIVSIIAIQWGWRAAFLTTDPRERLARYHGENVDGAFWLWADAWLSPGFEPMDAKGRLPRVARAEAAEILRIDPQFSWERLARALPRKNQDEMNRRGELLR